MWLLLSSSRVLLCCCCSVLINMLLLLLLLPNGVNGEDKMRCRQINRVEKEMQIKNTVADCELTSWCYWFVVQSKLQDKDYMLLLGLDTLANNNCYNKVFRSAYIYSLAINYSHLRHSSLYSDNSNKGVHGGICNWLWWRRIRWP